MRHQESMSAVLFTAEQALKLVGENVCLLSYAV